MPKCSLCAKHCSVAQFDRKLLTGDVFYEYYCPPCSNTKDGTFERHPLSWQTVIQLVLYHLHCIAKPSGGTVVFFRWKEDICGFIEAHWNDLIPQKNPGVSWQNSVSSVLSAHHDIFVNGLDVKGETGWWALRVVEPPRVKGTNDGNAIADKASLGKEIESVKKRQKKFSRECQEDTSSLIASQATLHDEDPIEIKSEAGSIDLGLENDHDGDLKHPTPSTNQEEPTSEQIKKQLLSRLLSEDSSILKAALHKVKSTPSSQPITPIATDKLGEKPPRSLPIARIPPIENELMRIIQRIKNPDAKIKRLRRKLLSRRERRRAGFELFDIDQFMYNYLKDPKPILANGERVIDTSNDHKTETEPAQLAIETPYTKNPDLSMRVKLLGITDVAPFPTPMVSPFSGRPLPEFIERSTDDFWSSRKGPLLHSIHRLNPITSLLSTTIDYLHLRKEHIPFVNRFLSTFFWPGIDVSEAAECPDYSIVAVHGRFSIIGVALLTPDAYLSYLSVHPDWEGAGIGSKLLRLLLEGAPPRDITLHVSATNPAMLLYNRFGFKPEQFIQNHYERYYRMADEAGDRCRSLLTEYSKHAFQLRLRR